MTHYYDRRARKKTKITETHPTDFKNLMVMYEIYSKELESAISGIEYFKKQEEWDKVIVAQTKKELYTDFVFSLKGILKNNHKKDIEERIPELQVKYQKEVDFAVSAWKSYGSELAGDFNKGEKEALINLNLYKSILR